eukprot:6036100-Alexandrium_andersonii.AAC.1
MLPRQPERQALPTELTRSDHRGGKPDRRPLDHNPHASHLTCLRAPFGPLGRCKKPTQVFVIAVCVRGCRIK